MPPVNYIVNALFKFEEEVRHKKDNEFELYEEMKQISMDSFRKNCQDNFEFVEINGHVKNIYQHYKETQRAIRSLQKAEDCNVLYVGLDVIALNKFKIFGKFKDFRLFNYTCKTAYKDITDYYNCDIRYIPSSMDNNLWMHWDNSEWEDIWDMEQIIYNRMFWTQDVKKPLQPKYAYQYFGSKEDADKFNDMRLEKAYMVHLHGSRSMKRCIEIAKELLK